MFNTPLFSQHHLRTEAHNMYAHYFKQGKKHILVITESPSEVYGTTHTVTGKREARKLAASLNAQPWNF